MTSNNLPNPLQSPQTSQPAIYRPRYQVRTANPSYALDGTATVKEAGFESLVDALEELEEWQAAERESRETQQSVRWHASHCQGLRVYIEPCPQSQDMSLFWKAARQWEAASGGQVRFEPTSRPSEAQIKIAWSQQPVFGRDFEVGHTDRKLKPPHWIDSATLTLVNQPAIDGQLSAQQQTSRLYVTYLHELGHALGLEHSRHKGDVMYHQGWRNTQLSPHDIQAVQQLYPRRDGATFVF